MSDSRDSNSEPSSPRYDAHLHLQDERLQGNLEQIVADLRSEGITRWVVSGTSPADWPAVSLLAAALPEVLPTYGLHPWKVKDRPDDWEEALAERLGEPAARAVGIGEIGLDKWIRDHDLDEQEGVFRRQLRLAAACDLPAVIHCLQAWGRLRDVLRSESLPGPGFLLHSFGGPAELIDDFVELGAYFSFSGHFLHDRKAPVREAFRQVPLDRLLVETDAPDMGPPEADIAYPLPAGADGKAINHPANLGAVYRGLAGVLTCSEEALITQVAENFDRFYGTP